jgi:hypothetical protein
MASIVVCVSLLAAPQALAGIANGGIPGAPRSDPLQGLSWGI